MQTDAEAGPPGELSGRVVSAEDGAPVAGARVFVSGTPLDVVTDADGRYRVAIQPGSYAISVIAPRFGAQTLAEVPIASGQQTERNVELTPAGLELPEFVVLEPFIEGSLAAFVEERRSSSAVTDILGAEQISRAGDSDAAGALKRVTGLTLVDGKFVFVRGLGERYSSVLFNGAQIPSPDPTRRVVPLDLF
ncbi:MAG: TonB-dependent receptor, partial [Gammaproteobacteria bacterium HGW-Gammaproteobacteria-7]